MHSKPTKPILYHCPADLYPKLQALAEAHGTSATKVISAAIALAWGEYVKRIDEQLDRQTGADDGTLR